jgi:phosphonate transport system ATP-binding protein
MSTDAVIRLDSVDCPGGGAFRLQIDHLEVGKGERIAIIGHNGAGKSTLFRLLSGFARPDAGHAKVLGHALHAPLTRPELRNLRCSLGQVMQGLHLVQRLTALENVLIGSLGRVSGWRSWSRCYPEVEVKSAQTALLEVGMFSRANTRTDQLSGGERQKVAIARMLMQRPELILADEPTAALDPAAAYEVCKLMVDAAGSATLISVVHNPSLLPLLASRVIGMKRGRIVFDLPIASVDDSCLDSLYRQETDTAHQPHRQGSL